MAAEQVKSAIAIAFIIIVALPEHRHNQSFLSQLRETFLLLASCNTSPFKSLEDGMGFSLNPLHDLSSALHTGEKLIGDGANDFKDAMKAAVTAVTHMPASEIGHTALNVAGMLPVIGAPADAINSGWYAAQGDWGNAALSAATAIPGLGDVVGGARLGAAALKIGEDCVKAERVIKNGTEATSTAKKAEKVLNAEKAGGSAATEGADKGAGEITKAAETPGRAKTYQTYTKTKSETGEMYSGRTSGKGTPVQNVARRDIGHHKTTEGFGPAVLDKSSPNADAIRGREEQLIEASGGPKKSGGTSGNDIHGISPKNPKRDEYLDAAKKEFGPF